MTHHPSCPAREPFVPSVACRCYDLQADAELSRFGACAPLVWLALVLVLIGPAVLAVIALTR